MGMPSRQPYPCLRNHNPRGVQPHFAIDYVAEQALPVMCNDSDEIRAGLGIVISPKPYGPAAMYVRIIFHTVVVGAIRESPL